MLMVTIYGTGRFTDKVVLVRMFDPVDVVHVLLFHRVRQSYIRHDYIIVIIIIIVISSTGSSIQANTKR